MGGLGNRGNSGQQLTCSAHLDKPLDPGHDVSDRGAFARGICNSAIFSTFPIYNHERVALHAHDTIVRDAWSSIQGTTVDHVSYVVCYDVLLVLDWPAVCARVLFYHSGSTHQFHFVSGRWVPASDRLIKYQCAAIAFALQWRLLNGTGVDTLSGTRVSIS